MKKIQIHFIFFAFIVFNSGCDIEEVNVPPEPEVRIVTPTATSQILDSTRIFIEAFDDRGIAKVELYIDDKIPPGGKLLYEPYEYMWNTEQYADSTPHTLYARATDTDSNITTSQKITLVTYRFSPSNLQATVVNDTIVRCTWFDNSSKETAFQLFESINDSGYFLRKTVPPNTTTTDIDGIFKGNVRYMYMIRAVIDSVKSKFSNTQAIYIVLSPPAGLNIHTLTDTLIELRWQQGTNSFEQYVEIEQRTGNGGFVKIGTIPSGLRSFTVTGSFKSGTNYSFRARAFSKFNVSNYSNLVTTNLPFGAPSAITIQHTGTASVQISWKDNSTFEKGFAIERLVYGETAFAEIFRTGQNDTVWTDISPDTTKTYQWRVRAFTDSNISLYTPAVYAAWFPTYNKRFDLGTASSPVTSVKFVPNSSLLVSSHENDAVNIWNADNGSLIRTITPATNGVYALAVSPDGNSVATGGEDGTIKRWSLATGVLQQTIAAHTGKVTDLHFNANGTLLASAGADSTAKVWNVATGLVQSIYSGHADEVTAVRFNPNGTDAVSGGNDNSVRAWNIGTASTIWSRPFSVLKVNALSFNGDGSSVAVGQTTTFGNPVVVLNSVNGDTTTYFNRLGSSSNSLEFSSDGISLVSCGDDGFVGTFHLAWPFIYTNVSASSGPIHSLALSPLQTLLATGGGNGTITVWTVANRWQKFNP